MPAVSNLAVVRGCCLILGALVLGRQVSSADEINGEQRQNAAAKWNNPLLFARTAQGANGTGEYLGAAPGIRASFERDGVRFRVPGSAFRLQFLGTSNPAEPQGEDPEAARVNYLIGDRQQDWSLDLPTYQRVVYHDLYPGVDVQFSFSGSRVKSEFVAAPGSDPSRIRFHYVGLGSPLINQRGGLTFKVAEGEFSEEAPEVYQWKQGTRVRVPARFALSGNDAIRFELGAFDPAVALTIDPVVSYSSYLGGLGDSAATAIAVDSNGNVYVTGWTDSLGFPLVGPLQGTKSGSVDAFVVKLNAAGNTLLYATYVGGIGDDRGYGIAIDGAGEAYIAGSTTSSNFPTHLPIQSSLHGSRDAFALKLNAAGNGFVFSTYLGGSAEDNGNAIAVDSQGNAYLAGDTTSTDFPTHGPLQTANKGGQDAFITKLSGAGALVYSTYLGGNGNDRGAAVAVDATGSAYITGGTFSNNFPIANAFQAASGGGQDCFVTKLTPGGNSLVYSTYLGGSGGALGSPESGAGIAVDAQGNAYVAGMTSSSNFPMSAAFQLLPGGGTESAFMAKLNSTGSALVYSTYLGGSVMDYGTSIAVDLADNAYAAGYTASPDFPVAAPIQGALAGGYDAFIVELNAAGNSLNFVTFYGGSGLDAANGIAVDGSGNAYLAGQTISSDFPIVGGVQSSMVGSIEAFVLKLNIGSTPDYSLSMAPPAQTVAAGGPTSYTVTATSINSFSGTVSLGVSGLPSGVTGSFNPTSLAGSGSSILTLSTTTGGSTGTFTPTVTGTSGSLVHTTSLGLTITAPSASAPSTVSVTPSSGGGLTQAFAFVFADTVAGTNILSTQIIIDATLTGTAACYFFYTQGTNVIQLANDAGAFQPGLAIGSVGTMQNSQCVLNAGASSVTTSGSTLTLNLAITFQTSFVGAKNVYMLALNAVGNSNWNQRGTWMVTSGTPNYSLSMAPAAQTVAAGGGTIYTVTQTGVNGFSGTVGFGVSGLPSGVTGSFNPTSLAGSGSSTLTVSTTTGGSTGTFTPTVTGTSGSLVHTASSGLTVTAVSTGPPSAVSVTPASGGGLTQTFALAFSDTVAAANIQSTQIIIDATLTGTAACYFFYTQGTNMIQLANDAGAFQPGLAIGSVGTMQNSQCVLNAGASSVTTSGSTLTLNLALTFQTAFVGAKNVYMLALNAVGNSNWNQRGTWMVTSGTPNYSLSMTPATQTVVAGGGTTYTVTQTGVNGFGGTVSLGGSGLPSGATGSFNPASLVGSGSSILTVSTTTGGSAGTFTPTVTGTSGSLVHTASSGLTITPVSTASPSAVSVTPASGTGITQTFAFAFSDTVAAINIQSTQIIIDATLTGTAACYLFYTQGTNMIQLASDAGAFQAGLAIGSAGTMQNSQCTLNAGASSVTMSGTTLTLNLAITFQTAFAGQKNVYMLAQNAVGNSNWNQRGTWLVTGGIPGFSLSMTPAAQTVPAGTGTTYTVTQTGVNGFSGTVSLGVSGLPSGVTGSFNPTSLAGSGSSTLTVSTTTGGSTGTFTPTVTGTSGSLVHTTSSGLTITPVSTGPPSAVSVTPAAGTGLTQTFAYVFADTTSVTNILSTQIIIDATLTGTGACYLFYTQGTNMIQLANDAGAFQAGLAIGSAGTTQNSQCVLNAGASSVTASGTTLTLNLAITFEVDFSGLKNVYMLALNAVGNSGWMQRGTWSVPPGNSPPVPVSVIPNNGNTSAAILGFTFSDPNGVTDLLSTQININSALVVSQSCYIYYVRASNQIYLANDAGTFQGSLPLGAAGTLQNSQCALNAGSSSVTASGTTLTLNVALTFAAGFAGSRNIYMESQNVMLNSGWVKLGIWLVP